MSSGLRPSHEFVEVSGHDGHGQALAVDCLQRLIVARVVRLQRRHQFGLGLGDGLDRAPEIELVVIAVAEELVWRGLVMGLLEEMMGSRRAWVWQAVLYALAHAPTAWALRDPVAGANPVVIVAALGCGLVWGGMARRFERLLPVVISHVLFDWVVVMMFRLWGPSV